MHHIEKIEHQSTKGLDFESTFARDVFLGLSHQPKYLSSKYFYDQKGDKIFQEIMHMDSYYLTRSELEIFKTKKGAILKSMASDSKFRILELGAGDGMKTKVLLDHFMDEQADFIYAPVDISGHVLELLETDLRASLPDLAITTMCGDYFEILNELSLDTGIRNIVLFLGSNIGNYTENHAIDFLRKIRANLKSGDQLMVGFDLKKNPEVILDAYHDPEGVTARFNYNLLNRINNELDADFDIESFEHHPIYDPVSGECKSYLLSLKDQKVTIGAIDKSFELEAWEPIFTEVSRKYNRSEISSLCEEAGYQEIATFTDKRDYFMDVLWGVE
jgi:dimethylhistidine N-methyltransferase